MDLAGFLLAVALAIAGIAATAIAYLRSRRIKAPCWSISTVQVVDPKGPETAKLRITYDGSLVVRMSVSTIIFWNDGQEAIRREDMAPKDPLRIETVESAKAILLGVSAATQSRPGCNFHWSAESDQHCIRL